MPHHHRTSSLRRLASLLKRRRNRALSISSIDPAEIKVKANANTDAKVTDLTTRSQIACATAPHVALHSHQHHQGADPRGEDAINKVTSNTDAAAASADKDNNKNESGKLDRMLSRRSKKNNNGSTSTFPSTNTTNNNNNTTNMAAPAAEVQHTGTTFRIPQYNANEDGSPIQPEFIRPQISTQPADKRQSAQSKRMSYAEEFAVDSNLDLAHLASRNSSNHVRKPSMRERMRSITTLAGANSWPEPVDTSVPSRRVSVSYVPKHAATDFARMGSVSPVLRRGRTSTDGTSHAGSSSKRQSGSQWSDIAPDMSEVDNKLIQHASMLQVVSEDEVTDVHDPAKLSVSAVAEEASPRHSRVLHSHRHTSSNSSLPPAISSMSTGTLSQGRTSEEADPSLPSTEYEMFVHRAQEQEKRRDQIRHSISNRSSGRHIPLPVAAPVNQFYQGSFGPPAKLSQIDETNAHQSRQQVSNDGDLVTSMGHVVTSPERSSWGTSNGQPSRKSSSARPTNRDSGYSGPGYVLAGAVTSDSTAPDVKELEPATEEPEDKAAEEAPPVVVTAPSALSPMVVPSIARRQSTTHEVVAAYKGARTPAEAAINAGYVGASSRVQYAPAAQEPRSMKHSVSIGQRIAHYIKPPRVESHYDVYRRPAKLERKTIGTVW